MVHTYSISNQTILLAAVVAGNRNGGGGNVTGGSMREMSGRRTVLYLT